MSRRGGRWYRPRRMGSAVNLPLVGLAAATIAGLVLAATLAANGFPRLIADSPAAGTAAVSAPTATPTATPAATPAATPTPVPTPSALAPAAAPTAPPVTPSPDPTPAAPPASAPTSPPPPAPVLTIAPPPPPPPPPVPAARVTVVLRTILLDERGGAWAGTTSSVLVDLASGAPLCPHQRECAVLATQGGTLALGARPETYAAPAQGRSWFAKGFAGDCTTASRAECRVSLSGDAVVTVTFQRSAQLSLSFGGPGGSALVSGDVACRRSSDPSGCAYDLEAGTAVSLTAAAADTSTEFARWTDACLPFDAKPTCVLTMNGDQRAGAEFRRP